MDHPYRTARLEEQGRDPEGLMPVSPTYGPDVKCPKCGKKDNGSYYLSDRISYVSCPKFCYEHKRVFIRWWPWPKRCQHPGMHLHQTCSYCGAHWVSWPLSEKPEDKK